MAEVAVVGVAGADRQGQVRAALVQEATVGVRRASIATRGQLSGYLFSKAARRMWCDVVLGANPRRLRAAMGDPGLARDLAAAAARNPRSTWCVTVTDQEGHAVGHGCARPARRRKPDGHDPPGGPRFALAPIGQAGGYGTWRLTTGQQELLIEIGPLPTGNVITGGRLGGMIPGSCSGT